jgi:peptide methionine sulfoxide reductase MsrB
MIYFFSLQFAEPAGYFSEVGASELRCRVHVCIILPSLLTQFDPSGFFDQLDQKGTTVFYDSVCGLPLFEAPIGRSFSDWRSESQGHGWPSFRKEEVKFENVLIHSGGEMASICGTHLGHNLPDFTGMRACIDLVCMAGAPDANYTLPPNAPTASETDWLMIAIYVVAIIAVLSYIASLGLAKAAARAEAQERNEALNKNGIDQPLG